MKKELDIDQKKEYNIKGLICINCGDNDPLSEYESTGFKQGNPIIQQQLKTIRCSNCRCSGFIRRSYLINLNPKETQNNDNSESFAAGLIMGGLLF